MSYTNCGCPQTDPCTPVVCDCPVYLSTDCVTVKSTFACSDIVTGQTLTETLEALDQFICDKFAQVTGFFTLINTGTGSEIYSGVNGVGQKKIRKLNASGTLIVVTQNTDDITLSIDQAVLTTFIQANQKTYTIANAGSTGEKIYKEAADTILVNNRQFNFKNLKSSDGSVVITGDTNEIDFTIPVIADTDIKRFIVNSAYEGTEELGTPSKPFKDLPQALVEFVGQTGTPIAPDFPGATIEIQKGLGYTFTGHLEYNDLTVIWEEGTQFISNPTSGYLIDYDNLADTALQINLIVKEGAIITLQKSGFKNAGTLTNSGAYATRKLIDISGAGQIVQSSTSIVSNIYTIFESNYTTNNNYHNDSSPHIIVKGTTISTNTQSIYSIGGNSKVDFTDVVISINGATSLPSTTEFFNQKGGVIYILNSSIGITPFFGVQIDNAFPISKSVGIPSTLVISDTILLGGMGTIFKNATSLEATVMITNLKNKDFASTDIAKSPSVVWTLFIPNNNILYNSGNIDNTQIDLTGSNSRSHYNIFNGKIVETLSNYTDRASAITAGLTKGNKFINRKTVTAGAFVVGTEYQIVSTEGGSTNFTLIGAPNNTVGTYFTATGTPFTLVGTGTGTAYSHTVDILI